jgi:hypothetical protein
VFGHYSFSPIDHLELDRMFCTLDRNLRHHSYLSTNPLNHIFSTLRIKLQFSLNSTSLGYPRRNIFKENWIYENDWKMKTCYWTRLDTSYHRTLTPEFKQMSHNIHYATSLVSLFSSRCCSFVSNKPTSGGPDKRDSIPPSFSSSKSIAFCEISLHAS